MSGVIVVCHYTSCEMTTTRSVSLPVVDDARKDRTRPSSRTGKWRAIVLAAIHVLIVLHIIKWLVVGSTLSPMEPSESMQTLELGVINAGFVLFALAILSTLIFGRFFCGWACHVVALQDACSWFMKKLGVHPKPFRSRLLVLAPVALGFYMFIWPNFKRWVVEPTLGLVGLERPVWLKPVAELHGFESEFIVADFWATFPPWYVAIPFLLICGFAAVYFLGSKGFCTYGCPYGGIFGPVERLAPGRIRVTDACQHCGHCTAVCTSNVRVHQEVHDFGMVVDPGCMKCMDCVSACPNDALYFGFGAPAIGAKQRTDREIKRPKYDVTIREEIALAIIGLVFFFGFRGMANLVPMLMAVGFAGIAAFLVWKLWSLALRPNVRLQSLVLKNKTGVKGWGWATAMLAVCVAALGLWGAAINGARWQAGIAHDSLSVPVEVALRKDYRPRAQDERHASTVTGSVSIVEEFGWGADASEFREAAYAALVARDLDAAISHLQSVIREGDPDDALVLQMADLMAAAGATEAEVRAALESAFERHPDLVGVRADLTGRIVRVTGTPSDELREWDSIVSDADATGDQALAGATRVAAARVMLAFRLADRAFELLEPVDPAQLETADRVSMARVLGQLRREEAAIAAAESALDRARDPETRLAIADLVRQLGASERAIEVTRDTVERRRMTASRLLQASGLAFQAGDPDLAAEWLDAAAARDDASPSVQAEIGWALFATGKTDAGTDMLIAAAESASDQPWWVAMTLGERLVQTAGVPGMPSFVPDAGTRLAREAAAANPDIPAVWNDLAQVLMARGDRAGANEAASRARALLDADSGG